MANKIDVFDENYVRNLTDKWLTNIVIPQVYGDSLSYYEEINKLIGCLSDISKIIDGYREGLLQEINDRTSADASLQTNIDAEKAEREKQDNIIKNKIADSIRWKWNIIGDSADTLSSITINNELDVK